MYMYSIETIGHLKNNVRLLFWGPGSCFETGPQEPCRDFCYMQLKVFLQNLK
jgi:hypothetical protein